MHSMDESPHSADDEPDPSGPVNLSNVQHDIQYTDHIESDLFGESQLNESSLNVRLIDAVRAAMRCRGLRLRTH